MENEQEQITTEQLRELLEKEALESGVRVKGEIVKIKTLEQREAEKEVKEWEEKSPEEIISTSQTEIYRNFLELVLFGNIHSLICISKAGYGKTYTTINFLKNIKSDFVYKSGYTTPLSFFHFLYQNREKIIILDDLTEDIFRDKKIIALLKSCLYEAGGDRFVNYETTSDALNVPSKFKFKGKMIILANELSNKHKETFKALISRGIFFELRYPFNEIIEISRKILENKKTKENIKNKVMEIIEKNISEVSEFNFRQLEQLIEMVKYNPEKAENLFVHSFRQDEDLLLVSQLMKLSIPVREQAIKFREETGYSTRKYYRIKAQIKRGK